MKPILVPLDGSEFGEQVLPWAGAVAHEADAPLHLAHVHVSPPREELLTFTQFQYEGVTLREYEEQDRSEERDYLDQVCRSLEPGIRGRVVATMLEGDVVLAVEDYADEIDAGLIVMSTHGRTGLSRAWLGSVADELVRSTTRPVLAVRPRSGGEEPEATPAFGHVLIPLDGSEASEGILPAAGELAGIMDSRFTLVGVVSPNVIMGARAYPVPSGRMEERKEKVGSYLESVAEQLRDDGFQAEARVVEGQTPAGAILDTADELEVDLVAMATHGHAGLSRAVLGSVSDKVLRSARRPVLLRRP